MSENSTALGVKPKTGAKEATGKLESQYVSFKLADQDYGIKINNVIEVIRMVSMAEPPEASPYVIGIINIRGRVVPVVDMRKRLALEPTGYTLATPILVAKIKDWIVGLVVDQVSEVITVPAEMVETQSGAFSQSHCMAGVAKIDTNLIFILDLAGLFSTNETRVLEDIYATGQVGAKTLA